MQRDSGLYRVASGAKIYTGFYDYATESIGPYKIKVPIPYLEKFHVTKSEPSHTYLYRALVSNPYALAVFFANNDYVGILTQKQLVYSAVYRDEALCYDLDSPLTLYPVVPVGYEKTYCDCKSIFIPPYKLMFNIDNNSVFLDNKWVDIGQLPDLDINLGMYKDLTSKENYSACYKSNSGEIKYLR